MNHPPLFIWREVPIDVDAEMYDNIVYRWGNKVYFISAHKLSEERRKVNAVYDFDCLYLQEHNEKYVKSLICENPDAIHLFAGMCGETWKYAKYCHKIGINKIITIGERTNRRATHMGNVLCFALNYLRRIQYKSMVKARIQMGELGIEESKKLGWNENILFPFMYCPNNQNKGCNTENDMVRFLYLGRFSKQYKGIDLLISAAKQLKGENWELDLVGGYGADIDYVISESSNCSKISVLGAWMQEDIVNNMSNYDVVVIPSTYDGWNLNVNYAIQANIGCIVTEQAGSADLIINEKNGLVIRSDSIEAIRDAMQYTIDNQKIIHIWKENNKIISKYITPQIISKYLISIIDYTCIDYGERPECPWRNLRSLLK